MSSRYKTTEHICVITTNKSPSILQSSSSSSSSSNSSIQILDPQTGSILSSSDTSSASTTSTSTGNGSTTNTGSGVTNTSATSIKINSGVGIHSIHPIRFQNDLSSLSNQEHLYIAYGNQYKDSTTTMNSNNDNKDMYAYLLVQGSSSSSSPKWKCKLPEYMSGKLICSPCGYFIIGGGKSGTCYCWSTLSTSGSSSTSMNENTMDYYGSSNIGGSELVCKWIAHYRSIQVITFSDCGQYVITGGDDGIVNVWSLMDIVSSSSSSSSISTSTRNNNKINRSTVQPIQTWSEHHLPITSIHTLPSSRMVSSSLDKQIIIMEIFNGKTLAKISMKSAITNVTSDCLGWRLYMGALDGCIYCVDMNSWAIANTAESAAVIRTVGGERGSVAGAGVKEESISGSMLEETVLGMKSNGNDSSSNSNTTNPTNNNHTSSLSSYVTELKGHNRKITCLALIEENNEDVSSLLVSGSIDGSIRIWDIRSRCCIRTLYPWSSHHMLLGQEMIIDDNSSSGSNGKNLVFPCSSITIIPRKWIDGSMDDDGNGTNAIGGGIFTSSTSHGTGGGNRKRKRKKQNNEALADLIKPLERFTKYEQSMDGDGYDNDGGSEFVMAFTKPMKKKDYLDVVSMEESYDDYGSSNIVLTTRQSGTISPSTPTTTTENPMQVNQDEDEDTNEMKRDTGHEVNTSKGPSEKELELEDEVKKLREEVARWQKVNNKLMLKLKKTSAK